MRRGCPPPSIPLTTTKASSGCRSPEPPRGGPPAGSPQEIALHRVPVVTTITGSSLTCQHASARGRARDAKGGCHLSAAAPKPREIPLRATLCPLASHRNYTWARFFSAQLGRFGSRDPIAYEAGVNLVEYVWDSPTSRVDAWGLQGEGFPALPPLQWPAFNTMPPRAVRPDSGWWRVCCRNVRGNWLERFAHHCDIRRRPCDRDSRDEYSEEYSVWRSTDPNRQLDVGTPCSCATIEQIRACVGRHPQSADPWGTGNGIGNNCQTATLLAIGACCLNSSWRPNWYAGNARGRCLRWTTRGYPPQYYCIEWELPDWINDPTEEPHVNHQ